MHPTAGRCFHWLDWIANDFDSHADSRQKCFLLFDVSVVDGQVSHVAEKSWHRIPWTVLLRTHNPLVDYSRLK
jgi:hypothetical protein